MKKFSAAAVLCLCALFFMGVDAPDLTMPYTAYTVQSGDNLGKIAGRYMPYTAAYTKKELINSIRAVNNITNDLSVGQTLNIPIAWREPIRGKAVPKKKDYVAKGVYINTFKSGTRFVFETAARLRKLSGNTIVFDAKDDVGAITYASPIPARYCPNEHYTPNIESLPKLIDYLHRQGVHVVARVVVFRDPIMARTRPDWCDEHREKSFLNPAHPEVQEYILTVVRELTESGVDEIQLDYVRYFADRKTTTSKEGMSRSDVITGFVKRVHDITAYKGILLSLDMFGIVVWQRDVDVLTVGQDVTKLKNHVDIISPMLYPSHFSPGFSGFENPADEPYQFIFSGVKRMKDLVGNDVVIRPWLQSFPLKITKGYNPKYVQTQIDACVDAGATGWLLWSPGNHYSEAYVAMQEVMKEKPRVKPQVTPELTGEPKVKESKMPVQESKGIKDVQTPVPSPQQPPARQTSDNCPTRKSAMNEINLSWN